MPPLLPYISASTPFILERITVLGIPSISSLYSVEQQRRKIRNKNAQHLEAGLRNHRIKGGGPKFLRMMASVNQSQRLVQHLLAQLLYNCSNLAFKLGWPACHHTALPDSGTLTTFCLLAPYAPALPELLAFCSRLPFPIPALSLASDLALLESNFSAAFNPQFRGFLAMWLMPGAQPILTSLAVISATPVPAAHRGRQGGW